MALTVSALANQVGLSPDTVHYYERVGLLPEPARYRLYDQTAVGRLRLREIGELLQVADQGQCPCGHTETLLHQRLSEVRAELERLRALEADLTRLLEQPADAACEEATTAAVTWWCAEDCPDPCEPPERR
jgi:DNA-binding transcriptional MerR regulator